MVKTKINVSRKRKKNVSFENLRERETKLVKKCICSTYFNDIPMTVVKFHSKI